MWRVCRIDDLGEINRGKSKHRPRNDARLFGGKYPFIQTGDVKIANLYINEYDTTYSEFGLAQSKLWPKDTLCITIAANIAESAILGIDACFPDSVVGFVPKKNIADLKFVKYLLDEFKVYMQQISKGTTQDNLSLDKLRRVKFYAPDYDTQVKIAKVISVYDDLIENNNRRIKILEKMAENLYKEWFVRFRFPGHEQTEFENGIPKGWERVRLSDIIDFNPTIKKTNHSEYKIIPMSALSNTGLLIDDSLYETSGKLEGSRSCNGDTLVARITPCLENGKTGFVQGLKPGEVVGGSTEFIVMRAKVISRLLVYFIARDPLFRGFAIASMNGADGRQRVKVEKLKRTQWIKPDGHINAAFEEKCEPIFGLIYKLYRENKNLTKQRDMLLPRLMSGKLEV